MTGEKIERLISSKNYLDRERLAELMGLRRGVSGQCEVLERLLNDPESLVRSAAIGAIAKVCSKRNLPKLLHLLSDNDAVVRIDAIEAVARLGGKRTTKYIAKRLRDNNALVRRYAAGWIGDLGDKKFVTVLERQLKQEKSSMAKVGIIEGLYLLGQQERVLDILQLLKSRRYRVRCAVANTLPSMVNRASKAVIREAILLALRQEKTVAARSSLNTVLKVVKGV